MSSPPGSLLDPISLLYLWGSICLEAWLPLQMAVPSKALTQKMSHPTPQDSVKCLITQNSRQTLHSAKFSTEPGQKRDLAKVTYTKHPCTTEGHIAQRAQAGAFKQLGLSSDGLAATHSWVWPLTAWLVEGQRSLSDYLKTMCLLPYLPQSLH